MQRDEHDADQPQRHLMTPERQKSRLRDEGSGYHSRRGIRSDGYEYNLDGMRNGSRVVSKSRNRSRSRSRSRLSGRNYSHRRRSPSYRRHRDRSRSPGRSRSRTSASFREREKVLERERERLRLVEQELRRERGLLDMRDKSLTRQLQNTSEGNEVNHDRATQHIQRSSSPIFTAKDIMEILNVVKKQPQPSTAASAQSLPNITYNKNILPHFDPSVKGQRIDVWLKKVNECATVYGWDERTKSHFALEKLQGLAKTWYDSLDSMLFTWKEWEQKLSDAFPFEQNYGQSLEDMLKRKSKFHEPIEVYYYEKLALLNQCEIVGKRAVECIIHGLSDKTMKTSAVSLRCSKPEELLQFLMSNKETVSVSERFNPRGRTGNDSQQYSGNGGRNNFNASSKFNTTPLNDSVTFCFNCKERGHPYRMCPKPLIKCSRCHRVGHKVENCTMKPEERDNKTPNAQKTMCITAANPNSKFYREAFINGNPVKGFIDFGSEVCLLTKSELSNLGLECDNVMAALKGFGNEIVHSIGKVSIELTIDGVSAEVFCQVVEDKFLEIPLLVGQTYTEQSHVLVYKNSEVLQFIEGGEKMPFSQTEIDDDNTVKVLISGDVNICGPSVIRIHTEPKTNGHILLNDKLIGPPMHQYMVYGGVYETKNGFADIYVTPTTTNTHLYRGMIVGRATRVLVVNRLTKADVNDVTFDVNCNYIKESDVRVGESINKEQKVKLLQVLNEYRHCFASNLKDLGCTNAGTMQIEVNSTRPIVYRPYRLSHKEREQVRHMIGEMLDADIIRESTSEYASPIILVRKKNGQIRICVDYRLLNSVTLKEHFPMPVIEDEIARLSGQAFFVTLDLASGYYQVPMSEQSKALTAFVTPDGQYEFNRMPFGLANAPAVFQRLMNKVLGSARFTEATVYIDDVLVYGRSVEECLERLTHVLQLLETANLTLNLSKCEFLKEKIHYLGYEVSASGIRPGDKTVKSVLDFPRPTNVHTVRQFLGLVGYFRKFIRNFAQIAHPLTKLLKKEATWIWSDDQENSFEKLKAQLIDRPVLAIYNPSFETELHTDASKFGIGGILLQRSKEDASFKPVAFYSRQTSPEERNFHAYELETLAVVCSLKKFRPYLMGQDFKVITDCSALRSTFSKRDIIPRIARWWLLMQEFHCAVEYRSGLKMAHVDALSRNPVSENGDDPTSTLDVDAHYPAVMTITGDDWLHTLQLGDTELCRIRDILTSDLDAEGLKQIKESYVIKDNKLYRCIDSDKTDLRWVVPKGARWQLCRMNHDNIGHFGVEKTLERLRKMYWFPKMTRFVKKYVEACIECAYSKKTTTKEGQLHPITKVELPFHTVHVDHLGPFVRSKRGNSYLLVVVDAFTKFIFIRPVRNTKSLVAIRVMEDIFYTFRTPDRLISDRGTGFTSHAFRKFCIDKGIKHVLNAVASPRSNGQVERYNRTILASLTALNLNHSERDWDDKVGKIQWGLNNTMQKTTGRTPAEVMFGTSMNSEMDPRMNETIQKMQEDNTTEIREEVKDKIDEEQEKQKQRYDKGRRSARIYSEGELVKITNTCFKNDGQSKKLLPQYSGPYRVISVLGNDRYRIAAIPGLSSTKYKRKTTVAADRMLPWVHIAALEVNEMESDSEIDESEIVG